LERKLASDNKSAHQFAFCDMPVGEKPRLNSEFDKVLSIPAQDRKLQRTIATTHAQERSKQGASECAMANAESVHTAGQAARPLVRLVIRSSGGGRWGLTLLFETPVLVLVPQVPGAANAIAR
jgi:hypothetical protein